MEKEMITEVYEDLFIQKLNVYASRVEKIYNTCELFDKKEYDTIRHFIIYNKQRINKQIENGNRNAIYLIEKFDAREIRNRNTFKILYEHIKENKDFLNGINTKRDSMSMLFNNNKKKILEYSKKNSYASYIIKQYEKSLNGFEIYLINRLKEIVINYKISNKLDQADYNYVASNKKKIIELSKTDKNAKYLTTNMPLFNNGITPKKLDEIASNIILEKGYNKKYYQYMKWHKEKIIELAEYNDSALIICTFYQSDIKAENILVYRLREIDNYLSNEKCYSNKDIKRMESLIEQLKPFVVNKIFNYTNKKAINEKIEKYKIKLLTDLENIKITFDNCEYKNLNEEIVNVVITTRKKTNLFQQECIKLLKHDVFRNELIKQYNEKYDYSKNKRAY